MSQENRQDAIAHVPPPWCGLSQSESQYTAWTKQNKKADCFRVILCLTGEWSMAHLPVSLQGPSQAKLGGDPSPALKRTNPFVEK